MDLDLEQNPTDTDSNLALTLMSMAKDVVSSHSIRAHISRMIKKQPTQKDQFQLILEILNFTAPLTEQMEIVVLKT